jgi:hypothetical protein
MQRLDAATVRRCIQHAALRSSSCTTMTTPSSPGKGGPPIRTDILENIGALSYKLGIDSVQPPCYR